MKKALLLFTGFLSVALGTIGIFLPLLPTTPFLLLAMVCFANSSPKYSDRLLNSRLLGKYIKDYKEKRGIRLKIKIYSISLLWAGILSSAVFWVNTWWLRVLLIAIAVGVTIHISSFKTLNDK